MTGLDSAATAYVPMSFGDSPKYIAQRPHCANIPGRRDFDDDEWDDFRDDLEDRYEDRTDNRQRGSGRGAQGPASRGSWR